VAGRVINTQFRLPLLDRWCNGGSSSGRQQVGFKTRTPMSVPIPYCAGKVNVCATPQCTILLLFPSWSLRSYRYHVQWHRKS